MHDQPIVVIMQVLTFGTFIFRSKNFTARAKYAPKTRIRVFSGYAISSDSGIFERNTVPRAYCKDPTVELDNSLAYINSSRGGFLQRNIVLRAEF